jgi:hypothetical protein
MAHSVLVGIRVITSFRLYFVDDEETKFSKLKIIMLSFVSYLCNSTNRIFRYFAPLYEF